MTYIRKREIKGTPPELESLEKEIQAKGKIQVSQAPAPSPDITIRETVPIDTSLAKLKAHRKPRKKVSQDIISPGGKDGDNKLSIGSGRSGNPADARKRSGGIVLPIDLFRKS